MRLIYKCPKCHRIIEELEIDHFNEEELGLDILTAEEKEDIIKRSSDEIYINLTCDDCLQEYTLRQLIDSQKIH